MKKHTILYSLILVLSAHGLDFDHQTLRRISADCFAIAFLSPFILTPLAWFYGAHLHKERVDLMGQLAATKEQLARTDSELSLTKKQLVETNHKLAATKEQLARTDSELSLTKKQLVEASNKLTSEKKPSVQQKMLSSALGDCEKMKKIIKNRKELTQKKQAKIDTKPQTHSKIEGEVNKKTINNTNPTANTSPQTYVFFYPTLTQINFKAPDQKIASQSFIEKLLIRIYDSGALWNLWKATLCLIGGCSILVPLSQKNQATKHLASAVIDFASLSNLAMAGYKFFRYSPQTISTQSATEAHQITNQDLTTKKLNESLKFV